MVKPQKYTISQNVFKVKMKKKQKICHFSTVETLEQGHDLQVYDYKVLHLARKAEDFHH